ncbi:hypothetical protein TRFO_11124 [Tritrichomonas foetus]|uniref:RSE1/DDB1/CPSF1 C-terminal domain-containing protein n=1 Tax=Tritrichomonas foetus TaxID=1144522 RepID=A0A1J4J5G0_9EUKA|nr:hypothetical protein TRFO_11124 [Tritrichomonas foetus]|eukprot:OHS94494.1 hypothetical protein TRFO_11124 [Tritrichomonas foetus]
MHVVHKTVIPCNNLLFSTIRKVVSSELLEVVMVYRSRVEFATIKFIKDIKKIAYMSSPPYPLEAPLIWAVSCNDYFCSITEQNDFVISDMSHYPEFHQISVTKLDAIPDNFDTKAVTRNKRFICLAIDNSNIIIIDIEEAHSPEINLINLNTQDIISIIPGLTNDSFAILVKSDDEKSIIFLDAENGQIEETINVDLAVNKIICNIDGKKNFVYCVYDNKIIQINAKNPICTTPSKIELISHITNHTISAFLEDESFYCYSMSNKVEHKYFEAQHFSKLYTMPNSISIVFSDNYFIVLKIPESKKSCKKPFVDLQKIEILESFYNYLNVNQLSYISNKLYSLSEYGISAITNQEAGEFEAIETFSIPGQLISLSPQLLFYSTSKKTIKINAEEDDIEENVKKQGSSKNSSTKSQGKNSSNVKISYDHYTTAMYQHPNGIVQVLKTCVLFNGKNVTNKINIIYTAMNGDYFAVIPSSNEIVLFRNSFKNSSTYEYDLDGAGITAITMCDKYIALATFEVNNRNKGSVFLIDYDFNSIGIEYDVPSPIFQMVTLRQGTELYLFSENGSIMKAEVNQNGFTNYCSYIYHGPKPNNVIVNNDTTFSFIANSIIMIYNKDHIVSTGIPDVISICCDSKLLWFVQEDDEDDNNERKDDKANDKNNDKKKSNKKDDKKTDRNRRSDRDKDSKRSVNQHKDKDKKKQYVLSNVEFVEFDDSHVAIPLSESQNPVLHFEHHQNINFLLRENHLCATRRMNTRRYKVKLNSFKKKEPLTFTSSEKRPNIYSLIVLYNDRHSISLFKYKNKEFKLKFNTVFSETVNDMVFYRNKILLSIDNEVKLTKIVKDDFTYFKDKIVNDSVVIKIYEYRDYIWTVTENGQIHVYQFNFDMNKFYLIATSLTPEKISNIHHVDETTIALGDIKGGITFYSIPLNVAIGSFHNPEKAPTLQKVFYCNTNDRISSFLSLKHCFLYSTFSGTIGALISGLPRESHAHLIDVQQKIQKLGRKMLGFNCKSRKAMCNNPNIVDYDFIDFYQKCIDPEDKEKLLDFYDISLITRMMQFLTF